MTDLAQHTWPCGSSDKYKMCGLDANDAKE
jgi:hypothetical protein